MKNKLLTLFLFSGILAISAVSIAKPSDKDWMKKLPTQVRPYLEKIYPGYVIKSAVSDPMCDGSPAIDVSIRKKGQPAFSLIFKPDGSYVQQEQDVPLRTAPEKIRATIKAKYGVYQAGNQIEKLTLADNSTQYLIDLKKGKVAKEVTIRTDGDVICEH